MIFDMIYEVHTFGEMVDSGRVGLAGKKWRPMRTTAVLVQRNLDNVLTPRREVP